MEYLEWIALIVVALIAALVIGSLVKSRRSSHRSSGGLGIGEELTVARRKYSRLSAAEVLARVRGLQTRNAQWQDIWSELNPGDDPSIRQLLLDLRNDGLQFAPRDGLRKIELACTKMVSMPNADAEAVLRRVLGERDYLEIGR